MSEHQLSETQKRILIDKATETPFSGVLIDNKLDGSYVCAQCGAKLFYSDKKYESGSGWPSFSDVVKADAVVLHEDKSLGMVRVEATCVTCGGHLGHVFNDGSKDDTGKRYCINSASLNFESSDKQTKIRGDGIANHE